MRILIIGGTRFIGPHVVQRLLVTGHEIAIFHRGQTQNNLPEDVQHILGDRRQLSQYREMLRHFAPEVVLDMMAMIEEDALGVMDVLAGIARSRIEQV